MTTVETVKYEMQGALLSAEQNQKSWFAEPVQCKVQTFWGDSMSVMMPEFVATTIAFSGIYEKELTQVMLELLKPGMTFFDIGAHCGYFSLLASRIVGEKGQVHSFEPTKRTFDLLNLNIACQKNVTTNHNAVFSEQREMTFKDFGPMCSAFNSLFAPRLGQGQTDALPVEHLAVSAISIDDYVERTGSRPDFIKIDAESAEYQIIQGMQRTLRTIRPVFTVEVGDADLPGVISSKDLVQYACSFDYRVFAYVKGAIVPHAIQARYSYDNLLFIPNRLVEPNPEGTLEN